MGFVENFKTLKTEDQKEIVKKEASYTNIGYNIFDAKSHISKASKKDFLDPIKTFVESKKILKRRYLFIDEIEVKVQ